MSALQRLVEKHPDFLTCGDSHPLNALLSRTPADMLAKAEYLIARGVPVTKPDEYGVSPMVRLQHVMLLSDDDTEGEMRRLLDMMRLLISHGAEPDPDHLPTDPEFAAEVRALIESINPALLQPKD